MAEKANLADIFRVLKSRRLKLLRLIRQEGMEDNDSGSSVQIDNLTDLLCEIQLNEEHLMECSSKILKNKRVKSTGLKDFVKNAVSEIKSSLHWLEIICAHYKSLKQVNYHLP